MRVLLIFSIFFQCSLISYGQGNTSCSDAQPICSDEGLTFTANTGVADADEIDLGNNYSCLSSQPNPSWYYLEIDDPGTLSMSLSAPSDIDFIIYGPFANLGTAQASCGNYGNGVTTNEVVDCSYSSTSNETPEITNAVVGEVYVMLITNYADRIQDLSLTKTGGTAGSNCGIVTGCTPPTYSINDVNICNGQTSSLDVALSGFAPFNVYYTSSVTGSQSLLSISSNTASIEVSSAQTIRIDSVLDATTCSNTDVRTVSVLESANSTPIINGVDNFRCGPGSVNLSATTNVGTISWYIDNTTGTPLGTGTTFSTSTLSSTTSFYARAVNNGCSSNVVEVVADVYPNPIVDVTLSSEICSNAGNVTIEVTPAGGTLSGTGVVSNEFNPQDARLVADAASFVYYEYTDANTCSGSASTMVTLRESPVINGVDNFRCGSGSVNLSAATNVGTISWYIDNTTGTPLGTGTTFSTSTLSSTTSFYAQAVNSGCSSNVLEVVADVYPNPIVDVTLSSEICSNAGNVAIEVTPAGGTLSGTGVVSNEFDPQDAGLVVDGTSFVYYDYIDANTCSGSASTMVTLSEAPVVTTLFSDTSFCTDTDVNALLSASSSDITASLEWLYNGSVVENGNSITVMNAGVYTVRANGTYCTSTEQEVNVVVLDPQVEITTPSLRVKENELFELTIMNPNSGYVYSWTNETTGAVSTGQTWVTTMVEDAVFSVVANGQHCVAYDQLEIIMLPYLKVPNVFTPNGDGVGDTWLIDGLEIYNILSLRVYNRWGNLVFENLGSYDEPWDGTYGGSEVVTGTYFYVIELYEGGDDPYKGNLTVLR